MMQAMEVLSRAADGDVNRVQRRAEVMMEMKKAMMVCRCS
jgi:hypothetical protein